ncbi:hypothetical protein L861_10945 [Litchfieldella anticariensis FP35 = DSM 16096]|uniref:Uncharacterized protein n=1 Tax=Litchfieldella anticariensis (strain DSM 16096 / CECT 5854 / CIP 108499 / LMG 22089 / FP35) TaxID=1121939 RepID=S2KG34_LITA3|nr:hypothetical protein L861_10945 [Halomonas anticariensis FP35 = DSM 16096]
MTMVAADYYLRLAMRVVFRMTSGLYLDSMLAGMGGQCPFSVASSRF